MADKTIKFLLVGEDKSASTALKGVGGEADRTGTKLKGVGDEADRTGTKLGGMSAAGVAALAAAGVAAFEFGKSSVDAYRTAEQSQRQLEDAYSRFPALADVSIESFRELNSAIQSKTGADDDALASAQAVMAQFGLTGQQIADLTPLIDDYAVKTGKDLPAAAEDLGKAMLGQGRALKDVGIDFADTGSVAGNFDQVMSGLRAQVGGFAEGEASSAEGQLRRLSAEFGDVQETVGAKLLPVLLELGEVLLNLIDWVDEHSGTLAVLATVVGVATVAMIGLNLQAQIMAAGGIVNFIKAWAAQQAVLNMVMAANPIALVVIAIAALVAGLIVAYNTSDEFRAVVDAAFRAVGDAGRWLWNEALAPAFRAIVEGFAWVMDGLANMLDALGRVPGFEWAADAANKLRGMAGEARSAAAGIQSIPPRAESTVNLHVNGLPNLREAVALGAQLSYSTPTGVWDVSLPGAATGGLVTGPGTGTSDSILARLSNGEFVMKAEAVRQIGVDRLAYANRTGSLPGFAAGGLVGSAGVALEGVGAAVAGALQGMSLTLMVDGQPIRGIIRAENSALATQRRRVAV